MPPVVPGQTAYDQYEQPLHKRAQALIDSLPEVARPSTYTPHVRFAWEARDVLAELLEENKQLMRDLFNAA